MNVNHHSIRTSFLILDPEVVAVTIAVLCDFDGTIVLVDTCVYILEKFAKEDWRIYDEQFERGKLTLEECLRKQFSTVSVPETVILDEIQQVLSVRSGFVELIKFCRKSQIPVIIVSAGLDFVINNFLETRGWTKIVKVHASEANCTVDGVKIVTPELFYSGSVNFKDDLVVHYKKQGMKVVFIGDGIADYYAAGKADFPFSIKDSKLATQLMKDCIPHTDVISFQKVTQTIVNLVKDKVD